MLLPVKSDKRTDSYMNKKNISHNAPIEPYSPEKVESLTIDLLRFPLAIMVIFIHMNPEVVNLIDANFSLGSVRGMFNVIGIIFSHTLSHIAVPTFFLISGFLFFVNFKQWSWGGYKKKMKSRVRTLIVPYFVWILTCVLLIVIAKLGATVFEGKPISELYEYLAEKSWHIFYNCNIWGTHQVNWLGYHLYESGPLDYPLWFLRDLIVVTLFAPVIYQICTRAKLWGILVLFLAYISRIWPLIPGFSITAFFYYSLGAYFALNGKSFVGLVKRYRYFVLPIAIILFCGCVVYDGIHTVIGQNIYPLFVCCGVFTAIYMASVFVERFHAKPNKLLVSSCFFIYAFHAVSFPVIGSTLGVSHKIMHLIIPGQTVLGEIVCYLTIPFLTAAISILVLVVFKRLFPKIAMFYSGNR